MEWDAASGSTTATTTISDYTIYAHSSTAAQNESSQGPCPTQSDTNSGLILGALRTLSATVTNPGGGPVSNPISFDATSIVSSAGKS